jgi:pimeloyl-ACP methyl ester carboxylesterase
VAAGLDAWPQVITTIGGQPVHAIHARSPHPDATPLLLLHGWPSTVADFLGVLPALTERFHVVAPSLPGFGFSGPTLETGWDLDRHADTLLELMTRAGYDRFVVQGGDWGAVIGPHVARRAPERVAFVHVNALVTAVDWTSGDPTAGLSEEDAAQVFALGALWRERQGYAALQSTRPQTLAHALNDSPVGLLAWDLEWFVDYDPAATVQTPIDPIAILTDVTITWLTGTAGSSARLYKEGVAAFGGALPSSGVPTAVACFPGDHTVRGIAERSHHVVRWTRYDRGGHFASLQAPDLLVADLVEAWSKQQAD